MKKIFLLLFCLTLCIPSVSFAESKPTVSLSDAIIADLALRNYLDYISIYYVDKKTKTVVSLNPTKQWLPASTVKLFVAMYACDQIAEKQISLDDWVTIDDKNVVPTELETDEFPVLTSGLTTTVNVLIKKMIEQSDNTAYNTLLDLLGRNNITAYVQKLGLTHTIVGSKLNLDDDQTQYEFSETGYNINTTTAEDYAQAFNLLENNRVPDSRLLLAILSHQKINNMLPAYLPSTLTIEHKTGDLDPLYHDGGIVTGNNRNYILTIFSNLGNPNILAHISQIVYTRNYALVGSTIPEKEDTSKPIGLQKLDPLVLNPIAQHVLGVETPLNIPLPNITAADLGISDKDISLAIPPKKLPRPFLPPLLNALWFALQKSVVLGEKARQDIDLSYAKSELGRAAVLVQQGKVAEATPILSVVSQTIKHVAQDSILPPDQSTQVSIQAVSDTTFALRNQQLQQTKNDSDRANIIHTIAQEARSHLAEVEPHLADAKAGSNLSQKPLIGEIIETQADHIIIRSAGGQTITVPITKNAKITSEASQTSTLQPSPSPTENEPVFKKGETIAVLGISRGKDIIPSLIVKDIPHEVAAPHPVVAINVNVQHNTMIVSDNGHLVQVDLTPKTAIKAKDTDIQLTAIKQGSVLIVHGDIVEPVHSDTPTLPATSPTVGTFYTQQSPTRSEKQTSSPLTPSQTQESTHGPFVSFTPAPTAVPSATTTPALPSQASQPEVIRATSIQVIQQQPTSQKQDSHKQEEHHTSSQQNAVPPQKSPPPPAKQTDIQKNNKSNGK